MVAQLAAQAAPPLEGIVNALIRPLTAGMLEDFPGSVAKLRFLVRLSFDRSPYLENIVEDSFSIFRPLLRRALPGIDERTLMRRWHFAADLAQHALANALDIYLPAGSTNAPRRAEFERFLCDLSGFIAGGLRG